MGRFFGDIAARGLDNAHQNHNDEDDRPGDLRQVLAVAVHDGEVAQTAGPQGAGDGGEVDEGDQRDGHAPGYAGDSLLQIHPPDDLPGGGAHGLGRLDEAGRDLGQGALHLPPQEGDGSEYQGDDSSPDADGGAHHQTAQSQQHHGQQDEGDGAEEVADAAQDEIHRPVLQNAPLPGSEQEHSKGDTQHQRDAPRDGYHLNGLPEGPPQLVRPGRHVWDHQVQQVSHGKSPPPAHFVLINSPLRRLFCRGRLWRSPPGPPGDCRR